MLKDFEGINTRMVDLDTLISVLSSDEGVKKAYLELHRFGKKGMEEASQFVQLMKLVHGEKRLTIDKRCGYFVNSTILNGIREQFDVLRFSERSILNIELKNQVPSEGLDGIKDQLIRHKMLLSIINSEVRLFSFVKSSRTLYTLVDDELVVVEFKEIEKAIDHDFINNNLLADVDATSMVISPYSEIDRFVETQYFLNNSQKNIVRDIMKSSANFHAIIGGAGTGKSLLLFDIGRKYASQEKSVYLVFCAFNLPNIRDAVLSQFNIHLISIKKFNDHFDKITDKADVLLFDEGQRLYKDNLRRILRLKDKKVIICCDSRQVLSSKEENSDIEGQLRRYNRCEEQISCLQKELLTLRKEKKDIRRQDTISEELKNYQIVKDEKIRLYELNKRVRTNEELHVFISKLLCWKRGPKLIDFPNVELVYFKTRKNAQNKIIDICQVKGYELIEPTEYNTKSTKVVKRKKISQKSLEAHNVIGREYDNVAIILDEYYFYSEDGRLWARYGEYYPYLQNNILFEAISRVKRKLMIIVINNPQVYGIIANEIMNVDLTVENENLQEEIKSLKKRIQVLEEQING